MICKICERNMEQDAGNLINTTEVCRICHLERDIKTIELELKELKQQLIRAGR